MKKNSLKFLLGLFILFTLFILFNQFDMTLPPGSYREKDLEPTIFNKDNGFYMVFALSEPPGVDIHSEEIINKYRRLFDPRLGDTDRFRYRWDQEAYRRRFHSYLRKARFINQKKTDWITFVKSREREILALKPRFSFLLERFEKLLACDIMADFSIPRFLLHPNYPHEYFYPYPDKTALLTVCRLYTALRILEILEGRIDGVQSILDQISFAKKLIQSARTSYTNLLGKKVLCLSLEALNNLMNRDDCPKEIFSRVFNGLNPLKYEEFGSRKAFIGYYLAMEEWIENKLESVKRHTIMGDAGRLFLQKNHTKYYYFNYVSNCIEYEKQPPFKWKPHQLAAKNLQKGSFWWLQNAIGKMIFSKDSIPDLRPDILASYQTKVLYDLTRISAELHLNYTHDQPIKEILNRLESFRTPDPYSGGPYIWDKKKAILYSVGSNRRDDGGVVDSSQQLEEEMLDIVIPCVLHAK
ncbi:hypothetical protein ACFLQP_02305 [Acidobacteriota bacterium]